MKWVRYAFGMGRYVIGGSKELIEII